MSLARPPRPPSEDSSPRVTFAVGAIGAGVVVYGFLSAPAPQSIRWIEIAIGVLISLGIGLREPTRLVLGRHDDEATGGLVAAFALLWLTWVPLVRGAFLGAEPERLIRDLVPLAFLLSPTALTPILLRGGRRSIETLAWAAALAGLLFTLRWGRHIDLSEATGGLPDGRNYLLNAPFVMFAGVFAVARAADFLSRGRRPLAAPGMIAGGLVCLAAPMAAVHRAAFLTIPPALAIACSGPLRRSRRLAGALVLAGVAAVLAVGPHAADMVGNALEKSRQVGLNARVEEAVAAIERASASPVSLMLGEGWGALLVDPAVGDWRVAYTHTAISYFLLKTGLLGIAALAAWFGTLVRPLARALFRDPALAAAALGPILAALTVQSAYKYLDTGILLALVLATGARNPLPGGRSRA